MTTQTRDIADVDAAGLRTSDSSSPSPSARRSLWR